MDMAIVINAYLYIYGRECIQRINYKSKTFVAQAHDLEMVEHLVSFLFWDTHTHHNYCSGCVAKLVFSSHYLLNFPHKFEGNKCQIIK